MASKEDTPAFVPTDITVANFLAQYEATVKNTMKRRSFETYHKIAQVHLLPAFGNTNHRHWQANLRISEDSGELS
jgi:hypothetical protein